MGYVIGLIFMALGLVGALTNITGVFMPFLWLVALGFAVVVGACVADRASPEESARMAATDQDLESRGL